MEIDLDMVTDDKPDDAYFDEPRDSARSFDESLLQEPLTVLPTRTPLVFALKDSSSEAMKAWGSPWRRCISWGVADSCAAASPQARVQPAKSRSVRFMDRVLCLSGPGRPRLR